MSITPERKEALINEHARESGDTGSPELVKLRVGGAPAAG